MSKPASVAAAGGPEPIQVEAPMAAEATAFVSVLMPHYNDLAGLDYCLSMLRQQDYPSVSFEIIVADNNSTCGLEKVRSVVAGRAEVVLAQEQGAGPARNAAARKAKGDVLAFIDSDCVPRADWLTKGVAALRSADFIGGRVDVLPNTPGELSAAEAFETVFAFDFESYISEKGFTGSGNMFVRREVFEAVGGFRKTVSEDMEWSHRARACGFRLAYAPAAIVGHPARRSWTELTRKWRRLVQESYAYHLSIGGGRLRWITKAFVVLLSPMAHVFKVVASPKLSCWRDRMNAAVVLFAIRGYRFLAMLQIASSGRDIGRTDAGRSL
jgi:cellulose synthase/poly-beta-1,6-N-acetylglucosamine synthase-like glycosyltransferase